LEKYKECFRQVIHFLYWILIVLLHSKWIVDNDSLFFLIIMGIILILIIKFKPKVFILWDLLKIAEREKDYSFFPWKWLFFFTIWAFLSLLIFENNIAYASILILWVWDAFSNIIWRKLWKHKWFFNKEKTIEWSLWGLIWATIAASLFVNFIPAVIASTIAILLESIDLKIFWKRIDDNLTIPVLSGFILSLFVYT